MAFTMPHDEALSALMRNHPTIQRTSLAAEQKKLEDIIAGQSLASNLSLSLSYSPRYPFSSSLTTSYSSDFAHSITDLYGADSGTDFTVTAGLTLHLFDGGRQAADHAAREASIRMAQNSLESQKQALRDQLEVDLLQKANLEEKVPMLSDAVDLAKRRLETETNLFRLGKSTQLNVDSRKADYDAKVNDLWRAKADLLLTAIDLQSLVGGDLVSALEGSSQ
jgi:outer membrane protein TolC